MSQSSLPPLSFEANLYDVRVDLNPAATNPGRLTASVDGRPVEYEIREYYVRMMAELVAAHNAARHAGERLVDSEGQSLGGESALIEAVWAERRLIRINDLAAMALGEMPNWTDEFFRTAPARRAQLSQRDQLLLDFLEQIDGTVIYNDDEL